MTPSPRRTWDLTPRPGRRAKRLHCGRWRVGCRSPRSSARSPASSRRRTSTASPARSWSARVAPTAVLSALGRLLAQLQSVRPEFLPAYDGTGVLVHGDFGPNNAVLDPAGTNGATAGRLGVVHGRRPAHRRELV
ncbi:MAG: phosphotransferase [Nocardioidaceae bacterium]